MPPPAGAELPDRVLSLSIGVPRLLKRPPPLAVAELPDSELLLRVAVPVKPKIPSRLLKKYSAQGADPYKTCCFRGFQGDGVPGSTEFSMSGHTSPRAYAEGSGDSRFLIRTKL